MNSQDAIKSVIHDREWQAEIKQKQNEFLDVYSLYLRTGISWVRDEAKLKAYEWHILEPAFTFQP